MRKVLLATTALATVSAVAAANAEVSLSGYYKFIYSSTSDNTTTDRDGMSDDTEFAVTFSKTTDSGLTFGMQTQVEGGTGSGATTIDEGFMTLQHQKWVSSFWVTTMTCSIAMFTLHQASLQWHQVLTMADPL